jgi:hypothetical protein
VPPRKKKLKPTQPHDPPVTTPGVSSALKYPVAVFDASADITASGNLQWDIVNYILALNGSLKLLPMTQGSVLFAGAGGLVSQDNAKLGFSDSTGILNVGSSGSGSIIIPNNAPLFSRLANGTQTQILNCFSNNIIYFGGPGWSGFVLEGGSSTYYIIVDPSGNLYPSIDSYSQLGLATSAYRWKNISSIALEICQTAALTAGSVGSLVVPLVTAGTTTNDATTGNLDGCFAAVWNGTTFKIAVRENGAWKYATVAGFGIPNYSKDKHTDGTVGVDETVCPLCHEQMKPGQGLGMLADKWDNGKNSEEGLHALAAHLKCLMKLD